MTELDELRREHRERVIGENLAELLARVVDATAPTYPPTEYSTSGTWDRASLDDAAQDWTLTRLLDRGDLAAILASARSIGALRSMLTRSFSQHLIGRRRRTSATNLFSRVNKLLRSDDMFTAISSARRSGDQMWMLTDGDTSASATPGTVDRLIKAAAARSDTELGVVRYGPYSLKSSPILRGPKLREFVHFLLTEAGGYLTTGEIFEVMRHRFNLIDQATAHLDTELPEDRPQVHVTVENRLLARSVLGRLGKERAHLLKVLVDADHDPQAAAQSPNASLAAINEATDRVQALIAEYAESIDDARAVYRHIVETLYGEDETR